MTIKNQILLWASIVGATLTLQPTPAHAVDLQVDCCGIPAAWVREAAAFIGKVEDKVNEEVNHYVSLANFDLGSQKFGIQGNASLGHLTAPKFDCKKPKEVLKSGMANFGIQPEYIVTAKLFGEKLDIVDARLIGAQGDAAAKSGQPRVGKSNILMSVLIVGVEVLHRKKAGPSTEAKSKTPDPTPSPSPSPSSACPTELPAQMTAGTEAKMKDINRSISQSTGVVPNIPIFPGVFIEFDAGFFLQASLLFTYGVDSSLYTKHGRYDVVDALDKNPANATDDFCEDPVVSASSTAPTPTSTNACAPVIACTKKSAKPPSKSDEFKKAVTAPVTAQINRFKTLKNQIKGLGPKKLWADAKNAASGMGADWKNLTSGHLSVAEICAATGNMAKAIRPLQQDWEQMQAAYGNAEGIKNDVVDLYKNRKEIPQMLIDGIPEVKANAGMAITGRAGGWAAAVLAIDGGIARGYAGIKGTLVLIDLKLGMGVVLSTKSQYVDLTVDVQQILLAGSIDLIYGVQIGPPATAVTFEDSINLFTFPGMTTTKHWLVGRLDFRAVSTSATKPMLFWCVNLFGNTTIDTDRCTDGFMAKNDVIPALAAHDEYVKNFLGEAPLDETANCIISDGGKPIITLHKNSGCLATLPANKTEALESIPAIGSDPEIRHPLSDFFAHNTEEFLSNLRTSDNVPMKIFTIDEEGAGGTTNTRTQIYEAASGVAVPTIKAANGGINLIQFENPEVYGGPSSTAPMQERIFSLNTRAQYAERLKQGSTTEKEPVKGDRNVTADLMINMDWMGSLWPATWSARPSNLKIYTGDLIGLPNDILIEMAKNFRMGRCQVSTDLTDYFVKLAGDSYPAGGDAQGRASVNMWSEDGGPCALSTPGNFTAPADGRAIYAACVLREALQKDECFPPSRAVSLVALANLSNKDAVDLFLGTPTTPKKISGDVFPKNPDYGIDTFYKVGESTNGPTLAYAQFFVAPYATPATFNPLVRATYGVGCALQPVRYDLDPGDSTSRKDQPIWIQERWWETGSFTTTYHRDLYVHFRATYARYAVGKLTDQARGVLITELPGYSTVQFKTKFLPRGLPGYTSGSTSALSGLQSNWSDDLICNSANRESPARFASEGQVELLKDAPGSTASGVGAELANAIRTCIQNGDCDYNPDGLGDLVPTLASTCEMKVTRVSSTSNTSFLTVPGSSSSSSLESCIQNTASPNFRDATAFCNDPIVRQSLINVLDVAPASTLVGAGKTVKLTASWKVQGKVDSSDITARQQGQRDIGTCTVHRDVAGGAISITGQTIQPDRSLASTGGTTSSCELAIGVRNSSTHISFRKQSLEEIESDPSGITSLNCWNSFGFVANPGVSSTEDTATANGICNSLSNSPDSLRKLYASDPVTVTRLLTTSSTVNPPSDTLTSVDAELVSMLYNIPTFPKSCTITLKVSQWNAIFNGGLCTVKLDPITQTNVGGILLPIADSFSVRIDPNTTDGPTACLAAIQLQELTNASGTSASCVQIRKLQKYLPFSGRGGARVSFAYGSSPLPGNTAVNCIGNYTAPSSSDDFLEEDNSCLLGGILSVPLPGPTSTFIDYYLDPRKLIRSSSTSLDAYRCDTAWNTYIHPNSSSGIPTSQIQFCQSNLPRVNRKLQELNNTTTNSTFSGFINVGYDYYKYTGGTPPFDLKPLTVGFKSWFANNVVSVNDLASCSYIFAESKGSFMGVLPYSIWTLTTSNGQEVTTNSCIRPTASTGPTSSQTTGKPDCLVMPPNHFALFGGGGPGFLAEAAATATNTDPFSAQGQTALCAQYMPRMTAVSEIQQSDNSKRFPLYSVRIDAKGNLVVPKDTDPAPMYCQPDSCTMDVVYSGESHLKPLGFFQSMGRLQNSYASCVETITAAAESTCNEFFTHTDLPDNTGVEIVAVYGNKLQTVKACERIEAPRECSLGVSRNSGYDISGLMTKPLGTSEVQTLSGHSGVFSALNTLDNCKAYFADVNYCSVDSSFLHDPSNPGGSYGVYRTFGGTNELLSSCYTSLTLDAKPLTAIDVGAPRQTIQLQWTESVPEYGTYEIQYCAGATCNPDSQTEPLHYKDIFSINDQSVSSFPSGIRVMPADAGVTYRCRIRLVRPAVSPQLRVALPWSLVAQATAQGVERNVILAQGLPVLVNTVQLNWTDTHASSDHYELQSCYGNGCTNFGPLPVEGTLGGQPAPTVSPIRPATPKTIKFKGINGGEVLTFRSRSFAPGATAGDGWSEPLVVVVTGGMINTLGNAAPFSITGQRNVMIGDCAPYSIALSSLSQNSLPPAETPLQNYVTPQLPSYLLSGGTGSYYADSQCTRAVTSVSKFPDRPSAFYYKTPGYEPGFTITATNSISLVTSGLGITVNRYRTTLLARMAMLTACIKGDLAACRAYVTSFPAGSEQDAAQVYLTTVLLQTGTTICSLLHWDCAPPANALYVLSLVSEQGSTKIPSFEVRGLPTGSLIKLLMNADSSCSNGSVHQLKTTTSDREPVTAENFPLQVKMASFRVAATLPDSTVACTNAVAYAYTTLDSITQVAAGSQHNCSVSSAGEVRCWGNNSSGQLGDGTKINSSASVAVSGLTASAVVAGGAHSCALLNDGSVKCWGANNDGQLGDGTTTSSMTPVLVPSLKATALAAGSTHTCALLASGAVKCWGSNYYGQIGAGVATRTSSFVPILIADVNATAITASNGRTCAILTDRSVKCWGLLGYTTPAKFDGPISSEVPVKIEGVLSAIAISTGSLHTCAIIEGGGVKCWGANTYKQLGAETAPDSPLTAVTVPSVSALAIASGGDSTCILQNSDRIKCWGSQAGSATYGRSLSGSATPVEVPGLEAIAIAISAGQSHVCAVVATGEVRCWGANTQGQLGDGSGSLNITPVLLPDVLASQISSGYSHTCALLKTGAVQCWGRNNDGQLGDGTNQGSRAPVTVPGLAASSLASGYSHTCALLTSGEVKCWGANSSGQLGNGTNTASNTPVLVPGISAASIQANAYNTCAVLKNGEVKCWGANWDGMLGNNTKVASSSPVSVEGLTSVLSLSMGPRHVCAVLADAVKCWGFNSYGALGNGNFVESLTPVIVTGLTATSVAAGSNSSCAITASGETQCWGWGGFGQTANATYSNTAVPGVVSGINATTVSAGYKHYCAIVSGGAVKCWGYMEHGSLGDGVTEISGTPVEVLNLSGIQTLNSDASHTCAITSAGIVRCWGNGYEGQVHAGVEGGEPSFVIKK
ncbi:MAG: hypothetical protein H7222_07085 [Methylotenera sp.]|nr:hypothetical protein [Oligoflexia bacterium]